MRAAAPRHCRLLPRRLPPLSGARASAAGARRAAAGRGGALFGRRCGSRAVGARAGRERVEGAAEANRADSTGPAEGTGLDEGDTGPQPVLPGTERLSEYLASPAEGALSSAGVVLASLLLAFETLQLPPRLLSVADGLEVTCLSLFTVEYLARWWVAQLRPGHLLTPLAVVDLISLVGWTQVAATDEYLPLFSLLRVLRLLRLLRYTSTFEDFKAVARQVVGVREWQEWQYRAFRVAFSVGVLFYIAAGLVYEAERGSPGFENYFASLYFVTTTLTTVGFGDVVPHTVTGKALVSASILTGAIVVPFELGALASALGKAASSGESAANSSGGDAAGRRLDVVCARCGHGPHDALAVFCCRCGTNLFNAHADDDVTSATTAKPDSKRR